MARIIGRGTAISPTNPLLTAFTIAHSITGEDGAPVNAGLVAPVSLEYEILDISTPEKENDPVVVVARTAVNLTTGKVATGVYAPTWTVSGAQALGRHLIVWYAVLAEDGPEVSWSETFDVMASMAGLPQIALCATISDVRAEGAGASITDRRIYEKLVSAQERLGQWTGRSFVPVRKKVHLDGTRDRYFVFHEPIIALESVVLTDGVTTIEPSAFTVYNRHLTGLLVPDDRENPRLEFRANWWETRYSGNTYRYPDVFRDPQWGGRTSQSIAVTGVFGYTEPDGSPTGRTPETAREVVVLMTLRELPRQNTQEAIAKRRAAFIEEMKTREQTVKWGDMGGGSNGGGGASSPGSAPFTGDPFIDGKIRQLCPVAPGGIA